MPGQLYIVATPIGNLQDISMRAIDTLRDVDLIACEDTRHSGKLLKHYEIKNKLISYHEHNEDKRSDELLKLLQDGKSIAVISDAGMPGISDPGFAITNKARLLDVEVIVVPGPVAYISAVAASGLPADSIFFGGFLPSKKGERRKRLKSVSEIPATLCFYETPHRIGKSLVDCLQILGNRKAVIVRELTKLHEEVISGDLARLTANYESEKLKGEIVLIIDRHLIAGENRAGKNRKSISELVAKFQEEGVDHKKALKLAAKEYGISKPEAYRILQEEKGS
ncbi:MAG: 16S rRNA (cytidine(1402)-2'-O)-methyltransferase [Pyrinomonadaceae bacterium]|nr:16S rRNA (cytidine(1402)-2'-O)-methyltransferase [Pyrinomonadaceae bacterium]